MQQRADYMDVRINRRQTLIRIFVQTTQATVIPSSLTVVSSRLTSPKGNVRGRGAEWDKGRKNLQFSANKPPYLRNGARWDQGYYDGLIGTRICALDWHQKHRHCTGMTFNGRSALLGKNRFTEPTRQIWMKIDAYYQWQNVGQCV